MLDKIIKHKRKEVAEKKSLYPIELLTRSIYFDAPCVSLKKYLLRPDKNGIIAEIKRKSPSKGIINEYVDIERTSIGYMMAGASALSVLTDEFFFHGKNEDLTTARKFNYCPILRKDFIVDEYQIIEAKSIGADAILLIAAVLTLEEVKAFTSLAHSLKMEVLLELHNENELEYLKVYDDMVGINQRNLKTFEEKNDAMIKMVNAFPPHTVKIVESGITSPHEVIQLKSQGFDGFLIGEKFMRSSRPEETCKKFIQDIENLKKTNSYEPAI